MASSPEHFDERDNAPDRDALESDRPLALTSALESVHGDSFRWASMDVADLDPPTIFPPDAVG